MKSNITIVGLVDNFKKEVAKVLADKLEKLFADVNEILIYNFVDGNMLETSGQEYFDKCENKVVRQILECENVLINVNLPTFNKEINYELFKEHSVIVYLKLNMNQYKTLNKLENYGDKLFLKQDLFKDRDELLQRKSDVCVEIDELSLKRCVENILIGLKYFFENNVNN